MSSYKLALNAHANDGEKIEDWKNEQMNNGEMQYLNSFFTMLHTSFEVEVLL